MVAPAINKEASLAKQRILQVLMVMPVATANALIGQRKGEERKLLNAALQKFMDDDRIREVPRNLKHGLKGSYFYLTNREAIVFAYLRGMSDPREGVTRQ
jgi:hypothetical protein